MTDSQLLIQNALVRYRRIRRRRAWLAAFGSAALVLALTALLDRTWMFSGWARWSGWVAGLAVAAWAARRAAGPACPDAAALAHQVESEVGESAPVVATAIDPAVRRIAEQEPLARSLLERLDQRADEALRAAPPNFRGRLRAPAFLVAAAVTALVALFALQGEQGLLRMLFPWQSSPYTSLSLEGPAAPVGEGQAFTLTARVLGVAVEQVTLYREGSLKPLAEAAPNEQGVVKLGVDGIDDPTAFVIRAGDGQSDALRIEPYALPGIEAFEIAVTPPGYAAHTAITETRPSFSVFRKSRMRYRIRLKAPAVSVVVDRSASVHREEIVTPEERAALKRGPYGVLVGPDNPKAETLVVPVFRPNPADPRVWESDWDLSEPGDIIYRLAIEGEHGDHVRNDEPWRINVLADAPPKVRIASHDGAEVIRFGHETVQFELSAVDDVRLAKVRLVYRKPGQPHTSQEITLPADMRRTWSGAELLALAPLDLAPFDIIAVHAEAEDDNIVDGPGLGRSEVVFLEVPLPESDDDGGGGGGGGGGAPPINPLELQMEILRSTMVLPDDAPASEGEALAHDQRQNAEYTGMIQQAANAAGLEELGTALQQAQLSMVSAAHLLDAQPPVKAIPREEAALGFLIEAAKLLEEGKGELPPLPEDAEGAMSFTLRPPKGGSSSSESEPREGKEKREELRKLMEEVQRQLAEQEALNQASGQPSEQASDQQSLAQDARSAASQARGIPAASNRRGDPEAAAEELERAAGLQDDTAEAVAGGDDEASARLGAKSAEALAEALRELSSQLEAGLFDTEADARGYERLVNDYLRSISYE